MERERTTLTRVLVLTLDLDRRLAPDFGLAPRDSDLSLLLVRPRLTLAGFFAPAISRPPSI